MTPKTRVFDKISRLGLRKAGLMALFMLALCAASFSQSNPLVRHAEAYATRVAAASGGTYVALRTLNAFLSSVQEVEVGGSFVVQGSVQPLKVLEPVDDTVERVASVVFAIMLIAGVSAVAMAPLGAVGMGLIALALTLTLSLPNRLKGDALHSAVDRLTSFGLVLALGVPMAFLGAALAQGLTAGTLAEHKAIIAEITAQVAPLEAEALDVDPDWTAWLGRVSGDAARYTEMAGQILGQTDEMIRSFLTILGIYVVQLVLLPALFFALILTLARGAIRAGRRSG